jgi:predicted Zn-dependent protease
MKSKLGHYSAAALLLLLAGCATVIKPPEGTTAQPAGAQPAAGAVVQPPGVAQPQPPEAVPPVVIEPVQKADMSRNRAVVALLDRAQADADAGKPDAAGAYLERALHIEPRNPWVWQQLAQMRLNAGRYDQAIALARKSNSFSAGKPRVQSVNWQLIAKARVAKGDSAGADEAFKKAADFAAADKAEMGNAVPGAAAPAAPAPVTP